MFLMLFRVLHLEQFSRKSFDVFNISTDDTLSVKQIADFAIEVMELERSKVEIKFTGGDRGWKGDVPKIMLSNEKIKLTGWRPVKNSKEAMIDSLKSLRSEVCFPR